MKKLSIVTPVFNSFLYTKSFLNDISHLKDHEIIIVDNGSTDETYKELANNKNIKYIRNDKNLGFAKACNIGYQNSESENVLFLNNDIKVRDKLDSWTNIIIEHCSDYLVGPTMGLLDNDFNFIKEANEYLTGNSYLSGWCLASSKNQFSKLIKNNQLFSEDFFCYFEDTDLGFRAKQKKMKIKIVDIPVVHYGKKSSQQLNTRELYIKGKQIFDRKWKR